VKPRSQGLHRLVRLNQDARWNVEKAAQAPDHRQRQSPSSVEYFRDARSAADRGFEVAPAKVLLLMNRIALMGSGTSIEILLPHKPRQALREHPADRLRACPSRHSSGSRSQQALPDDQPPSGSGARPLSSPIFTRSGR
jgi:hypothetical protein